MDSDDLDPKFAFESYMAKVRYYYLKDVKNLQIKLFKNIV